MCHKGGWGPVLGTRCVVAGRGLWCVAGKGGSCGAKSREAEEVWGGGGHRVRCDLSRACPKGMK